MKLSVIIPIYNERSTISEVLDRLDRVPVDKEVIVVDDGSSDGSREYLLERSEGPERLGAPIRVVVHPLNRGKGAAIRTGLAHVTGDVVIIQDADLEYGPEEIPDLLQPILDGEAEVVYGSRFLGTVRGMRWPYRLANRLLTLTTNLLYGAGITDEATGYKLFRRTVLDRFELRCEGFSFCPEVTSKVLRAGIPIHERPIHSYVARYMDKKISWHDAFVAIWVLFRERLRRGV